MKKRVLITGATGFVGEHLHRFLSQTGDQVLGTYHRTSPRSSSPAFYFERLNLNSRLSVDKFIDHYRPDFIYHLAAQSISSGSNDIMEETLMTNTGGTVYLLSALRRFVPTAKFLLASSSHSYGRAFQEKVVVNESDCLWPENAYAVSKVMAEFSCREFSAHFNLRTVVARSFNHMGTGQRRDLVFSDWCRQIALAEKGKRPPVLEVGNLDVERDFMHVEDVIRAYVLLMSKGRSGEVYNVCSKKLYKLRTYLNFLLRKAAIPIHVKVVASKIRSEESKKIAGDPSKIQKLGWQPRRNAFDALEELLAEWRQKVSAPKHPV